MNSKVATLLSILSLKASIFANDPVGHWRFDSENSEVGAPITETTNFANPGTHDASLQGGNPLFSSEVPGKKIYDPVSGEILENNFSLNFAPFLCLKSVPAKPMIKIIYFNKR